MATGGTLEALPEEKEYDEQAEDGHADAEAEDGQKDVYAEDGGEGTPVGVDSDLVGGYGQEVRGYWWADGG